MIRPLKMLIFSPIVFILSLYMAVVYGLLYLLFTTITTVFTDTYHWAPELGGLAVSISLHLFHLQNFHPPVYRKSNCQLVHRSRFWFLPWSRSSSSYIGRYGSPHDESK